MMQCGTMPSVPIQSEEWRAAVSFVGRYEVSDLGRVRSPRRWTRAGYRGGVVLQQRLRYGYWQVRLFDGERYVDRTVHSLVLEAFEGPRPEGMEGRHGPGGRRDNRRVNLSYGTQLQNMEDREHDGMTVRGERHPQARLTEENVREMRRLWASERHLPSRGRQWTQRSLAVRYGVSKFTVAEVISNKRWTHVTLEGELQSCH